MKKIFVRTGNSVYPVIIGTSILDRIHRIFTGANLYRRVFVLVDKKVFQLYEAVIKRALERFADKIYYHPVSASEKLKTLASVDDIYKKLIKNNFYRDTLLVAIGGGAIGDAGGFVASTYMRGIQLVHIPTSLLAAVDSSIGGKTALNLSAAKNIIGTFYQPSVVIIDCDFLQTLKRNEIVSGVGEIIKYSYLSGTDFYSYLLLNLNRIINLNASVLYRTIAECAELKAAIVSRDERELNGLRKALNFGHTFAHAFESYFNFKLNHGNAVIAGIAAALFLSFRKKILDSIQLQRLLQLPLLIKNKRIVPDYNSNEVFQLLRLDKKNKNGKLNFVLIKGIGEILIDVRARRAEILYALDKTKELLI
jgi:3-dehydroquinate synthase